MLNQGLAVTGGEETTSDTTEEGEAQMYPDMIIKCLVATRMVFTEGAEPGIYWGREPTVVDRPFPEVHRHRMDG